MEAQAIELVEELESGPLFTNEKKWEIAMSFRQYVGGIVKKYAEVGLIPTEIEGDAVQDGLICIVDELDRFDSSKGTLEVFMFSTIRGKIIQRILGELELRRAVRLTKRNIGEVKRLERIEDYLRAKLGHAPSDIEIAEWFEVKPVTVERWRLRQTMMRVMPEELDLNIAESEDAVLGDTEWYFKEIFRERCTWQVVQAAKSLIREKPARGSGHITRTNYLELAAYLIDELTLEQLGARRGVSREAARQSLNRTIVKLQANPVVSAIFFDGEKWS